MPKSKDVIKDNHIRRLQNLLNNWPVLFQNVKVIKDKDEGAIPDQGKLETRD